jgi:hypothetical protein
MRKTSTKLLVIAITSAAIIAAVTTTSLSAGSPAFAKVICHSSDVSTGGEKNGAGIPGGHGGR